MTSLFLKKRTVTLDRSTKTIKVRSRNIVKLTIYSQKFRQIFAQFNLQRAPDSGSNVFSKWDKHFVVIINDYKTV